MYHVVDGPDAPDDDHRRVYLLIRQPRVVAQRMHDRHVPLQRQKHQVVRRREEQRPDDVAADPEATVQLVVEAGQCSDTVADRQGRRDEEHGTEQIDDALVDDQQVDVVLHARLRRGYRDDNEKVTDDSDTAEQYVNDLLRRGCDASVCCCPEHVGRFI